MTLLFIFLLILIATCLLLCRRRFVAWMVYAVAVIIFLVIGCGWAPREFLTHWQAPYAVSLPLNWGERNAIVLLGMSTERITDTHEIEVNSFAYGRVARTAVLYRACKKSGASCQVIVSGGDARGYGRSEAAVYGDYLLRLGVGAADLMLEDRSMNTWQNAQFTSALLRSHEAPFDRVWLVSSAVHLTRSALYFSRFGVDVTPVRADYLLAPVSLIPMAYNVTLMDIGLHEYMGVLRTRLYDALGWNIAPVHPGAL